MKKVSLYILASAALVLSIAYASEFHTQGLGFTAPTVFGTTNVANPQVGDIVYDQTGGTFSGYNQGGSWISFASSTAAVATGTVTAFAGTTVPAGYLLCDGSAVSRTTYSGLFSVIGIAYGEGDGSTTFNVPDLRGRFLRGVDGTAGNDPDKSSRTAMNTGGNTGNAVGSIQADQFASHSHGSTGIQVGGGSFNTSGNYLGANGSGSTPGTQSAGGNETRPKNAYVYFIVKY